MRRTSSFLAAKTPRLGPPKLIGTRGPDLPPRRMSAPSLPGPSRSRGFTGNRPPPPARRGGVRDLGRRRRRPPDSLRSSASGPRAPRSSAHRLLAAAEGRFGRPQAPRHPQTDTWPLAVGGDDAAGRAGSRRATGTNLRRARSPREPSAQPRPKRRGAVVDRRVRQSMPVQLGEHRLKLVDRPQPCPGSPSGWLGV